MYVCRLHCFFNKCDKSAVNDLSFLYDEIKQNCLTEHVYKLQACTELITDNIIMLK